MMKWLNITKALNIKTLFILISVGILSFLGMEFVLKMEPCKLCLMQRIPYYTSFAVCILYFIKFINCRFSVILIFLCFLSAFFIAGFHFLVEEHIVGYSCLEISHATTIENLKKEIYNSKANCSIKVNIFGIRIVLLSLLYNLFTLIFCMLVYKKNYINN